jgi:hypothetical protein
MKTNRGRLRVPQRTDSSRQPRKLRGPTCCPGCGAVYRRGRWRWEEVPAAPRAELCPACRRVREREPVASVTLSGEFLASHRDEILARVRACERAENRTHPLKRIIAVSPAGKGVRITTTDAHLARRIGDALRSAYKGELRYRYRKGEDLLQVSWSR